MIKLQSYTTLECEVEFTLKFKILPPEFINHCLKKKEVTNTKLFETNFHFIYKIQRNSAKACLYRALRLSLPSIGEKITGFSNSVYASKTGSTSGYEIIVIIWFGTMLQIICSM